MEVVEIEDNRKSTLLDDFERLSVEIQINQAMLRRSLSEPGTSLFYYPRISGAPPLVRQPVEQGKRGSWGLYKVFKKLIRPIFIRRKSRRNEECYQKAQVDKDGDGSAHWKRFSKSVRV